MPTFSYSFFLNSTISNLSNSFSALSDSVSSDDSPNTSTVQEKKGKQKGHQLKNVQINCRSLKGSVKRAELASMIEQEAPDIICGSESHLKQSIPSSEIFPDSFQVFRKDRNRSGGGVFIAVKNAWSGLWCWLWSNISKIALLSTSIHRIILQTSQQWNSRSRKP